MGVIAALQFGQVAVLARFLSPSEFGLMGMLQVVVGFAQSFADMGITNAIIHRQCATREELSSLYWLNVFAGFATFALVVLSIPLIIAIFHEPRLKTLVMWVALSFVTTPFGQQFQTLLQKELRFRSLAITETTGVALGVVVSIIAAFHHAGVYALIWGVLTNNITQSAMLVAIGWREWSPALHFRRDDLRGYLSFGAYQMGERSLNYFNQRFDQLLVGSFLGTEALGYYSLAYNIVIQPVIRINPILTRVAFPVFARVQDNTERLQKGYTKLISMLSLINFPLLIGLAAIAPSFVPVAFGDHWTKSVVLIQILAFVGLVRCQMNPIGAALYARGRADLGFKWTLFQTLLLIPCLYLGAKYFGVIGMSLVLLGVQCLFVVLSYLWLLRPVIGPFAARYFGASAPALGAGAIAGVLVSGVVRFVTGAGGGAFSSLVAGIVVGVVSYMCICLLCFREQIREMWEIARGRIV